MTDTIDKTKPALGVYVEYPDLLDKVRDFVTRFVAFPSESAADAVALWTLHTHVLQAFDSTPRLLLLSPEKGSGKTRTLEVLELLTPNAMHAVNMSVAALFRSVGSISPPTLLFDEADTYFGPKTRPEHEELRGLINAGHRRGAMAYRCVGQRQDVEAFPAFAAAALAGLGDLPDTILDRGVPIRMRRRASHERVEHFRFRYVKPQAESLRHRIQGWASRNLELLSNARPPMPEGVVDRAADVWEPLLAIADTFGPEWGRRARGAAVELNNARMQRDPSFGLRLLADIKAAFDDAGVDRLTTADLLDFLTALDEAPWGDVRGKPLDSRGLARRLNQFDIRPHQVRFGDKTLKGYTAEDFADTWSRYLSADNSETSETSDTEQRESRDVSPVSVVSLVPEGEAG